jgi:8-oxo-dGTP diphosphatase
VPAASRRQALTVSVDVVALVAREGTLGVAVVPAGGAGRDRWRLPCGTLAVGEAPVERARRVAREHLGHAPALVTQVGALGSAKRHPGDVQLSIGCLALFAADAVDGAADAVRWVAVDPAPALGPRHRLVLAEALGALRRRIGDEPLAFRLLPPAFTLSELQGVYEVILGRALHKASFRRTLHAAEVVEPTDAWRSEGRGRPAQLFRFVPGNPGADRHLVRFDFGD